MNARFNGLYNSEVMLNQSITKIREQHTDDYSQIISVFPFGTAEIAAGQKSNLEEVYKKTSKMINKHEKSRWVDDGWFLIGKSYFFQYDAYSAIEAFQYVINQFPDGERRYDAKLWIVLSYIQQGKYYDAEAIMALINDEGGFPQRLQKDLAAISGEIYIRQGKYSQAIVQMEKALALSHVRDEKSRYNFILGQLYSQTSQIPKAKEHYVKTIKLNPPYEMAFQANLGLIDCVSLGSDKSLKTPRKHLKKMLKDDKNIDYYDQIYYQLAELELQDGNRDLAKQYFSLSATKSSKNNDQKATAYLALAKMYFEERDYQKSQKYFDSTAMFVTEKRPDYEEIKATQLVLTDLIENLVTIFEQDSLLKLASMSRDELDRFINDKIRREQQIAEQKEKDKQDQQNNFQDPFVNSTPSQNSTAQGGTWYFYNPSAVARGSNDFRRKWGDRKLSDNWRIASLVNHASTPEDPGKTDENPDENEDPEQPDDNFVYNPNNDKETQEVLKGVEESKRKYYEGIPFSDDAKKASNGKIAKALFGAGVIYEEDLKEYNKAKQYFNSVLERYPGNSLEPEVYFHLHRIAGIVKNPEDEKKYSDLLRVKYPKSPFNLAINNREVLENMGTEKEVSILYSKMYDAFMAGDYDGAIRIKTEADQKYAGNALQAKFDYLYAMVMGKTQGKDAYLKALERIVENYPGTTIANTAQYTIELLKQQDVKAAEEPDTRYKFNPSAKHFFITVYDGGTPSAIQTGFSDYNKMQHQMENLQVTIYPLGDKNLIAVQSFANKDEAEKYYIEFIKKDPFFKQLGIQAYENYTISADNFRILLSDKNADAYATFFFNHYIQ